MVYYGIEKGMRVAVAGLGGLGSMAVKFAVAFGCHVTVLSRGTAKKDEAINRLGAHDYVDNTDKEAMAAKAEAFDRIIDTIACEHDINLFMSTIACNGKLVLVGASETLSVHCFSLLFRRKSIVGSLIGGIKETQEMLNFCGEKEIFCDVEVISPEKIDEAYNRAVKGDVHYRFSIDCKQM